MQITKFEFLPEDFAHEDVDQNSLWAMVQDVYCELQINNNEFLNYTLKKGFTTNYRSGPRWLDKLAPKFGNAKTKMCWMVHDANYEGYLSQEEADKLLYYMLLEAGLEAIRCEIVYVGLRIFGSFKYNDKKDNPKVIFEHKVIPMNGSRAATTRSIDEEFVLSDDINNSLANSEMQFNQEHKIDVHEELRKIAKEYNMDYDQKDLEPYYEE